MLKIFVNILILLLLISQVNHVNAEVIPPKILEYLTSSRHQIRKVLLRPFEKHEFELISQRMAEKLIIRYASEINNLPNKKEALQKELTKYISTIILTLDEKSDLSSKNLKNLENLEDKNINKDLLQVAEKITQKYPGKLTGNILRINYQGSSLPLDITVRPKNILIRLYGAPLSLLKGAHGWLDECLNLKIDKNTPSSFIDWIGTMESACPLPVSTAQGDFLLKLAEDISALLVKRIDLVDQSRMLCQKILAPSDLRLLRIFQNKDGWYQSRGYTLSDPLSQHTIKERTKSLHAITLVELDHVINTKKPSFETKLFRAKKLEYQLKFPTPPTPYLFAHFMAWLWENDCAAYSKLLILLEWYEDFSGKNYSSYIESKLYKILNK